MSENLWVKRAKLCVLSLVGIAAVSIPVAATLLSSAMGDGSPLALGAPARVPPTRENPTKAITESLQCAAEKGRGEKPRHATGKRAAGATFRAAGRAADPRPKQVLRQHPRCGARVR